jgi:cell division protein FtsZ
MDTKLNNYENLEETGSNEFNDGTLMFEPKELPNIIKVLGGGGGGSNAVNYMFSQGIKGVDFVVCNTDAQALNGSPVPLKVKLGNRKLGAGSKPEVGKQAAIESAEEIKKALEGETEMLFVTAGMGGGTGTGAAPVIAKIAKEMDILTVGIVTIPFEWEGAKRINIAKNGIEELRKYVDTLIVISNNKLREVYGNLSLKNAFSKADDILKIAAKGIAELITVPGYVNVDFQDVKTVMTQNESGKAIMSSAIAEGEDRALSAVQEALSSPLLDDNDIRGANDILLHIITGTKDLMMDEIEEITEYIQEQAAYNGTKANLVWGNGTDESLGEALSVTIIATGFNAKEKTKKTLEPEKTVHTIGDENPDIVFANPNKKPVKEENIIDEPVLIKKEEESNDDAATEVKEELIQKAVTEFFTPVQKQTEKPDSKTDKVVHDLFSTDNSAPVTKEKLTQDSEIKKTVENKKILQEENSTKKEVNPEEVKHAEERREKLMKLSKVSLSEMEKVPAFQRRNVKLDNSTPSSEENISRYSLGTDENDNPVINKGNTFLHEKLD